MKSLETDQTICHNRKLSGQVGGSRTKVCEICYGTTFDKHDGNLKCRKCGQIYYL